jgi:ribonuclease P protein component
MLAQPNRLPASIRLTHSQFVKTPLFAVRYKDNKIDTSRFAFLVRKTVDKRSTVRNRIRRVFRSCIEEHLSEIKPGYDMIFFLEKGIMDKSRDEVWQALQHILKERKLLD